MGIVCADEPDKLVAVRKDSPLILGLGQGFTMLASDVTALIRYTREVCYLDDGEMAVLTPDGVKVYNSLVQPVEKETSHVDWEISAAEKGGYEHFMFKEIMEQPKAIRDFLKFTRCVNFSQRMRTNVFGTPKSLCRSFQIFENRLSCAMFAAVKPMRKDENLSRIFKTSPPQRRGNSRTRR